MQIKKCSISQKFVWKRAWESFEEEKNDGIIFLSERKRIQLDNLFERDLFITIVGIVAGVFTASSMLPQVIKTLKEKEADSSQVEALASKSWEARKIFGKSIRLLWLRYTI